MTGLARHLTLRQRLIALVAFSTIPILAALVYLVLATHRERERDVRDQALRTSELAALEIERIVAGAGEILKVLATGPTIRYLTSDCDRYLGDLVAKVPEFSGFLVADEVGTVRCAAGLSPVGADVSGQSWFQAAMQDGGYVVGEYTRPRPDGPAYLPVAFATGAEGPPGVVMTGIDLAWLGDRLAERSSAPGSSLAVADRNGTLLAREPDPGTFVGTAVAPENLPLINAPIPGTFEFSSRDGTRRILGYQPVNSTGIGLYVSAGISTRAAFAPIYASTWRSLAFASVGALAAFGLAWWAGDRLFRRPILRMLATIASWRAGDESARSGLPGDGTEIAALAHSIDEYMDNLAQSRAERAAAERHRALLLREMNHRIKNILAAVQAIANQTFKGQATDESLGVFGNRLAAMAGANDLLVSHNWESAELRACIETAVAPFSSARPGRFALDGPPVRISAKAAMAFAMALHELCTNAAKYGALSTPDGGVAIRWRLAPAPEGGGERLHLSWTERGGPEVSPPGRRGFGMRLIETALAGELSARADVAYDREGLCFTLDADAAGLLADAAEPKA